MRLYLLLGAGLVLLNSSLYQTILAPHAEIRTVTVGKGVATILRSAHGKTLLIDAGSDAGILRAVGTTIPMWERHLGAIILTSDDGKSRGGLAALADRYRFPEPTSFGTPDLPYGLSLSFDGSRITVIAPHTYSVSYGATTLAFSSSTPERTFTLK